MTEDSNGKDKRHLFQFTTSFPLAVFVLVPLFYFFPHLHKKETFPEKAKCIVGPTTSLNKELACSHKQAEFYCNHYNRVWDFGEGGGFFGERGSTELKSHLAKILKNI